MRDSTQLLFSRFVDPSQKDQNATLRKRIRSHIATAQHRKAARRNSRYFSPHEKILIFNRPALKKRHCSVLDSSPRLTSEHRESIGLSCVPEHLGLPLDEFHESDKKEVKLGSISKRTGLTCFIKAARSPPSHTMLKLGFNLDSPPPRWHLEDPTDDLSIYCKRLGESMPNVLVSLAQLRVYSKSTYTYSII